MMSTENILLLPRNRRLCTSRETALEAAVVQAPCWYFAVRGFKADVNMLFDKVVGRDIPD